MKKIVLFLFIGFGFLQANAQCEKMFSFKEGSNWTWTNYNKKGKFKGKTIQVVDRITIAGPEWHAYLKFVQSDVHGNQTKPVPIEVLCRGGMPFVDMKKFLPNDFYWDYNIDASAKTAILEMPENLVVGDRLKEGKATIGIAKPGSKTKGLLLSVVDRTIISQERVSTSAGKFDCLILEQTIYPKNKKSKGIITRTWYALEVGIVKSETYRKGKLTGYSILTTYNE